MKHSIYITAILLVMFFISQLIGIAMIKAYAPVVTPEINQTTGQNITISPTIPYGYEPPKVEPAQALPSIIIAMIVAILILFLLMKIKANIFLRLWFFAVAVIAIGISLNGILLLLKISFAYQIIIITALALVLGFFKVFRRSLLIHNLTELVIYPGIAVILVPLFNLWAIIIFLILISLYDMYAVWQAKFMQKMAKFQINHLKIFSGFFLPSIPLKDIKNIKDKSKAKKIKVSLAILGGGDIALPILAEGVIFLTKGFLPALIVSLFATLALFTLFLFSRKGKFYPAMPFITAGIFLGMLVVYLLF
jgi:presenilin-like A22 family membrane protease